MRANGTSRAWANQLHRKLHVGEDLGPIRVARIGKALYVIDGFHRLQAHQMARRGTVWAEVARMSKAEALEAARVANTAHGKRPSRADQQRAWETYLEGGGHLRDDGTVKGSTTIERELGFVYSRETIRRKLRAVGVEIAEAVEWPEGRKVQAGAGELEEDRLEDAVGTLEHFRVLYLSLDGEAQRGMLATARALVDALEHGEEPQHVTWGPLDI